MKKTDVEKWVERFQDLDADNQLQIVEKIVEELSLNEEVLSDDGYDVVKSSSLKQTIEDYISNLTSKSKIEKVRSLLDRFGKLDKKHKINVIGCLIKPFEESLEKEEHDQLLFDCKRNGHTWSSWEKSRKIEFGIYCPPDIAMPSSMKGQPYSYEVSAWIRTCCKCGYKETRDYEDVPEEIVEKRKQDKIKRNKQKIKKLQEETKKLEDKE